MNKQQSTGSASRLAFLGAIVMTIANFAIAWMVSLEGAALAGVFFVSTAIVTILGNSTSLGTMTGVVYFMPQALAESEPNARGLTLRAVKPVLALSTAVAAVVGLLAPMISDLVTDDSTDDVTTMLQILAFTIIPWALTQLFTSLCRALGTQTPTVAITQVIRPGMQIVLLAILFVMGDPQAWMIAVAWGVPVTIGGVASIVWAAKLGGFTGSGPSSISGDEFWSYTRPRAVATALQIALERIDVVLVSAFVGTQLAGVYGALTRFITAGNFLMFSVSQAVSPDLRQTLVRPDWPAARDLLQKTTGWLVLIAWPYFLVVALKPSPLASLLSPDYVPEASILSVLAIGMLVSAAAGPVELALLMLGRSTLALVGVAAAIVIDLVLLWALASRFGLMGAAAAWSISVAIQNLIGTWFVHRVSRDDPQPDSALFAGSRRSLIAAVGSILVVVPIALITPASFVGLLITGAVAAPLLLLWALNYQKVLGFDELLPQRFVREAS